MTNKKQYDEARALHHLRAAQSFGWRGQTLLTDTAQAAMEAEGHDADLAAEAIARMWREHFETQPPI